MPRFEVRLGKLGLITRFGQVEFIQKRVDNLLTVDLVRLSWTGKIHKAILVTGDSDFVPAVEEAKNAGVLTQVYYLKSQYSTIHDELYTLCDDRYEITEELIRSVLKK